MADRFGPEFWSQDRQIMVFRWCGTASPGARWTFRVRGETLAELCPGERYDPFDAFARARAAIYCAAAMKISTGDPADQHLLTTEDIRAADLILSRHDGRRSQESAVTS